MKIGVFDSGLGGLTVLQKLIIALPQVEFIYLADTKNLPYGNRSSKELYKFAQAKVAWMQNQQVDLLVIACNTSDSVLFSEDLSSSFPLGIVKMIEPIADKIAYSYPGLYKLAVMSTTFTAKINLLGKLLTKYKPEIEIKLLPCAHLALAIENLSSKEEIQSLLEEYLQPLLEKRYQALILACSHYPLIEDQIHNFLIKNQLNDMIILNPAEAVVEEVLKKNIVQSNFKLDCYITDLTAKDRLKYYLQTLIGKEASIHHIMPLC
jgi:glutamate racemase